MDQQQHNNSWILPLGLAIGAYIFVRKFTNFLGITDSSAVIHQQEENQQASTSDAFDPYYWQQWNIPQSRLDELGNLAENIHDAWGFFNDDEEKIYAQFRAMRSKAECSYVTYYYSVHGNTDLYNRLVDGLSTSEMNIVVNIVNALPGH